MNQQIARERRRPSRRRSPLPAATVASDHSAVASVDGLCGAPLAVLFEGARLSASSRAVLAAGRRLADRIGRPLVAACVGGGMAEPLPDYVLELDESWSLAGLTSALSLAPLVDWLSPAHLLFDERTPGGGVAGRALASRLGVRPNVGLLDVEQDRAICRTADAALEAVEPLARVILVDHRFALPLRTTGRRPRPIALAAPIAERYRSFEDLGQRATPATHLPVSEAALVVSGGAGVTDWALFRRCADQLGAAAGASRAAVDAGFMPRDRQIGSSGVASQAELYLAFGISGAVQHLEGIERCGEVISVNTDRHCAMVARADLAIAADCDAVLAALSARIERNGS